MMTIKVRRERVEKRFRALPGELQKNIADAVVKGADDVAGQARRFAPVDSGDLRDSITVTGPGGTTPPYSQPGGSQTMGPMQSMVTVGNTDVRYPHLVEYGTQEAKAQPFFWPAYRLLKKRVVRRIKTAVGKALRRDAGL